MFESIFQYYGFDWLGMIATFLSIWWIGDKHWYGFLAMFGLTPIINIIIHNPIPQLTVV